MCMCNNSCVFRLFSYSGTSRKYVSVIFLVLCLLTVTFSTPVRIKREVVDDSVQRYLMQFGYMPTAKDGAFALRTEESVREAIRDLQRFAGIPETGRMDNRTERLLRTPRCGVADKNTTQTSGRRKKRFTLQGHKWPYTDLTWSLRSKNLNPNLDSYEVRLVIARAFAVWARHSKLTFREVDSDKADILVYFYKGDHGDNFPFDGKGVILAHAFFPNNGHSIGVHFDADENWTTDFADTEGTNLFNVASHEFGHSLGLSHSSVEDALMYPWYKDLEDGFNYELPEDDRLAIQKLYGAREDRLWDRIPPYNPPTRQTTTTTTTTARTHPTRPRYDPYNPRQYPYNPRYPYPNDRYPYGHPNGRHHDRYPSDNYPYPPRRPEKPVIPRKPMHPDKKPYYPKYNTRTPERVVPVTYAPPTLRPRYYPTRNPDKHPHHRHPDRNQPKESPTTKPPPDKCDTSYDAVAIIRRETFIFKDAYFWRITDRGLMKGNPFEITRLWRDLPENLTHVDAVYERPDNKIVFFIDDKYYVFTANRLDYGYPKPLTDLGLPPDLKKIDGAMVWGHNEKTYFYSGNRYWKFDEEINKVELDYPRGMSMWRGVGTDIDAVFQWKDGKTYFFKGKGFWQFNDLHMRVEHEEQRPSAPFWMACTNNMEGARSWGEKLPYKHITESSGTSSSSSLVLNPSSYILTIVIFIKLFLVS